MVLNIQNRNAFVDITNTTIQQENSVTINNRNSSNRKVSKSYHKHPSRSQKQLPRSIRLVSRGTIIKSVNPSRTKLLTGNEKENEECYEEENSYKYQNDQSKTDVVNEYVEDIFQYLYKLDKSNSKHLKHEYSTNEVYNRETLVNWIIGIHWGFNLLEETLYLAVFIIDKYQSIKITPIQELQILGITSLFIASKFEEIQYPSLIHFCFQMDGSCTVDDIKDFERNILEVIGYDLSYSNPLNFLRRMSQVDDYDLSTRTIAKYLLEITLIDSRNFFKYPKSQCAAASMFLARKMFGKNDWNSDFIEYSGGYCKKDMISVCKMILKYIISPEIHEDFQMKYQSKRYLRASIICKKWALKILKDHDKRTGRTMW